MTTVIQVNNKRDPSEDVNVENIVKKYSFRAYARLTDMNELSKAVSLETMHFFFLDVLTEKVPSDLIITDVNNSAFSLINRTYKTNTHTSYVDTINGITREMFVALRNNSTYGYKCRLFKFPVLDRGDVFWEVMCFWGNDGQVHPWVLISIVDDEKINHTLPFSIKECIIENDPHNDKTLDEFINNLWSKEYAKIDERDVAIVVK